ncbi:unnamed protein product [Bursaphelenchus okinawaensis]|uniref:UDP-xylose and UDP-N-acetylglucosamine transporter n=1 Tax=Bursaphelenchus okinawaensis TaxID=465554 RepID=A0A811KRY9_9BILA|nr:unnamed protein product [Bursaphelenchus okinawaensis]CAG9112433.1 unnamed protein product [Bursaphelenchus okinawaensis]
MSAAIAIGGTLGGCMTCMVVVESLAKSHTHAMNLMTFSNFLFISLQGLIFTSRFLSVPNKIPLRAYIPVVVTFCFVNIINNLALSYRVPVPLHIIFRSGSLLSSLVMNRLLLGRQYTTKKYLSVVAITIGIIMCTLAEQGTQKSTSLSIEEAEKHLKDWSIGITMLTIALIASSYLAICQEKMYTTHGKHPDEAMFYVHALSLPFFAFFGRDIVSCAQEFNQEPALELFGYNLVFSQAWWMVLATSIFQYFCIKFVYMANAYMDSLSVTLLVTLRKFLSLLVSIIYFNNVFTATHWAGAILVFGGTLVFSNVILRS